MLAKMWSNFKFHLQLVKIHVSTIALGKDVAMSANTEYTHNPMTQQVHLTVYLTEMCTCVFSNDMHKDVHSIIPN